MLMPDKPTYEALENRLRELEKAYSENKRAEEELREVKDLNEGIVQTISDGIVLTDTDGIVTYVNPALATMLGCQPTNMIGRFWLDFVWPEQRAIAQTADERRTTGQADRYELTLQREDGSRLFVLVGGNPRYDKQTGQFAGTLGVITDISAIFALVSARRKIRCELHQNAIEGPFAFSFHDTVYSSKNVNEQFGSYVLWMDAGTAPANEDPGHQHPVTGRNQA